MWKDIAECSDKQFFEASQLSASLETPVILSTGLQSGNLYRAMHIATLLSPSFGIPLSPYLFRDIHELLSPQYPQYSHVPAPLQTPQAPSSSGQPIISQLKEPPIVLQDAPIPPPKVKKEVPSPKTEEVDQKTELPITTTTHSQLPSTSNYSNKSPNFPR